jgi:ATP-dependent DNA helicase RecG
MNPEALIRKGESGTVEFKEKFDNETIETVVAFANAKGGIILIGVSDNGEVKGIKIGKDTVERITNKILQTTDPKIYPKISVRKIKSKKIVIVEVEESKNKPCFIFGRAFKRVGKSSVKMSKGEIEKLILERRKIYWDEQICKGASLKDIDEKKVKWFLRKAKYERNFDIETETPVEEVLGRLELMKNGKLTNAAILLFGRNPQKFFYQAETRCARFKGTEPVKPFLDMKVFDGNIIDQVDKALNFVLEHIPMAAWLVPGQPEREEKYEYPPDAVREAIINAICHRDYSLSSNVQIRIFDDRLEVWGCGPLPEPLTTEDLKKKHRSILRNPSIAKCFFLIKFIEQWGTGTNDMIEECLNWGLPEPVFELVARDLVVTFWKSKLTEDLMNELGLNERQKRAINYLKEQNKITTKKYCEIFNVVKDTANRDLNDLLDKGLIKRGGSGPKTYYTLSTVRYRPIPSDTQTKNGLSPRYKGR